MNTHSRYSPQQEAARRIRLSMLSRSVAASGTQSAAVASSIVASPGVTKGEADDVLVKKKIGPVEAYSQWRLA